MSIPAIGSFSTYSQCFNSLTGQLSGDLQSRSTTSRIYIPERPKPPSVDSFPLPKIDAIPKELHEDSFFEEHIDPISYEPIFDPVLDKNEPKHIYERATIVRWLQNRRTSPLTREPMTEADLVPVRELKEKIDEKIQIHLLQKQKEKLKEAEKRYQKDLDLYHFVNSQQYATEYQSSPYQMRTLQVIARCFADFSNSWNAQFNRLQSLQVRVSVISLQPPPSNFTSPEHGWSHLRRSQ